MGKTPDELQREIAELRNRTERKIDSLEDRVRGDVEEGTGRVTHQVGERLRLQEYVEQRPLTALAGAVGAGVLIGLFTGGGGDDAGARRSGGLRSGGRRAGGMLDDLVGAASGLVGGTLEDEARKFIRQTFGERPDIERAPQGERPGARGPQPYAGGDPAYESGAYGQPMRTQEAARHSAGNF
jgi:ElaB/YqjD/DUF883 family membrane-anchored ribosome-binding protein